MTLRFATRLLLFFFLLFGGLYYAKAFLIPIALAGVLAMLLLPLAGWLEGKGIGPSMATALSVLAFLLGVAAIFTLLGLGMKNLASDMGNIEQKVSQSVTKAQDWLTQRLGLEASGEGGGSQQSGGASTSSDSASKATGQQSTSSASSTDSSSARGRDSAAGQASAAQQSSADTASRQESASDQSGGTSGGQQQKQDDDGGGSMGAELKKTFSGGGSGGGGLSQTIKSLPGAIMSFLTDAIITLVYLFLFLRFRRHFKRFVIKIVPEPDRRTALGIMHDASSVTQKYLTGMGAMIVSLWIMYGIGFTIVGVKGALFFAVLCGTLELIPFIGNIVGTALTLLVSLTQSDGGGGNMVLGIVATYFVVQTVQSYLLEPLVVGRQVKLHPAFTILVIVLGELLWGIPGMALSVPLLGIAKIICDRVPALQPYGYLIGEEENANDPTWKERVRGKLSRIFRRR